MVFLTVALGLSLAMTGESGSAWTSPFQGRVYTSVPAGAVPLAKSACDGDQFNKCTFNIALDADGDGKMDRAYLANHGGQGLVILSFGQASKKPVVMASFDGPFTGGQYLERQKGHPDIVQFIVPESSMALLQLRNGKPQIRWIGD